jgi:hypothetical protein
MFRLSNLHSCSGRLRQGIERITSYQNCGEDASLPQFYREIIAVLIGPDPKHGSRQGIRVTRARRNSGRQIALQGSGASFAPLSASRWLDRCGDGARDASHRRFKREAAETVSHGRKYEVMALEHRRFCGVRRISTPCMSKHAAFLWQRGCNNLINLH